jgi:hypothetical protein
MDVSKGGWTCSYWILTKSMPVSLKNSRCGRQPPALVISGIEMQEECRRDVALWAAAVDQVEYSSRLFMVTLLACHP